MFVFFVHFCCRVLSHDARVGDRGDKRNSQSERRRTLCGETQRSSIQERHTFLWHHRIWPRELPATAGLYFFPSFNHLFIHSHFVWIFLPFPLFIPSVFFVISLFIILIHCSFIRLFVPSSFIPFSFSFFKSFLPSVDYLFVTLLLPSSFYFFHP